MDKPGKNKEEDSSESSKKPSLFYRFITYVVGMSGLWAMLHTVWHLIAHALGIPCP